MLKWAAVQIEPTRSNYVDQKQKAAPATVSTGKLKNNNSFLKVSPVDIEENTFGGFIKQMERK